MVHRKIHYQLKILIPGIGFAYIGQKNTTDARHFLINV